MNTCDTCKYWRKNLNTDVPVFGACDKGIGRVGQYPDEDGCIGDGRSEGETGEGMTGSKFGCIHHRYSPEGLDIVTEKAKTVVRRLEDAKDYGALYISAISRVAVLEVLREEILTRK